MENISHRINVLETKIRLIKQNLQKNYNIDIDKENLEQTEQYLKK